MAACSANEVWQTNFRGLATYTIKKFDVLVSAIMRSVANAQPQTDQNAVATNGLSLNGNYDVTSQQVQAAIGRPLPGGAATQSVNLVLPGALYQAENQHARFQVCEGPSIRQDADQRRVGPVQHLQLEHRHVVQPGVWRRTVRRLTASADDSESAVLAVQRHRGLLVPGGLHCGSRSAGLQT